MGYEEVKRYVIKNVRLDSAAGHYVGSLEFGGGDVEFYDRDSEYYPNEKHLHFDYPTSISREEAFSKATMLSRGKYTYTCG